MTRHNHPFNLVDKRPWLIIGAIGDLRDLCDENDERKPFGGKTILLCGDLGKTYQLSHMNHVEL